jgi:LytR cell envelope-related transcriptional attenuator
VQGPPFLREERSAGRTTALIVGGVVFGVAVLVGALLSLGGGGSHPSAAGTAASHRSSAGRHAGRSHHTHAAAASAAAASPAEIQVVVLNGTETNGLAHRISTNLQQSGYTQSAALDAHPAGRATSVVQYSEGHRSEARQVAQTLGIGQVEPLESALAPLVGAATVVVVAGADQAALGSEG